MKNLITITLAVILSTVYSLGQSQLVNVKSKTFKTTSGIDVKGKVGYLEVLENRSKPDSRKIKLKFVHLKSTATNPGTPIIYLEGGGGISTTEAENPKFLDDWLEYLAVSDFIFLDRRGAGDNALEYLWTAKYPRDFFLSEEKANAHYQNMASEALRKFEKKNIDITGYNIEEHANDVQDLMDHLDIPTYTIFGFSYGTHIGMTVMQLFPDKVERAVLVGTDAPYQAFNYPSDLDRHMIKIAQLVEADSSLNMSAAQFQMLVEKSLSKLKANPVEITVKHPFLPKKLDLSVGDFGLALILRLDIDDYYDIPVIPCLLHSINEGDYSILQWFIQKRMTLAMGVPGQGINQQLASSASSTRWATIEKEAKESLFGNVVNFPFSAVKDSWVENQLSFDPTYPVKSEIPTLFITGTLDCRTSVEQTEDIMQYFTNASHVKVENAGHEQAQWSSQVANEIIPSFLMGEEVKDQNAFYANLKFLKLEGATSGHPAVE